MKNKILKSALIIFLSGVLFFSVAYVYLNFNLNKSSNATDQKEDNVSYELIPKNRGIVIVFPQENALMVYLDFNNRCLNVVNVEKYDSDCKQYYGYTADYTVKASYSLLQEMVDRVGGINIKVNGETMRYTGTQVIDLIASGAGDIKGQIISQIFSNMSKNNFSKDDIIYLIENCETDISFIDCIYWLDYIKEMSANVNLVN